MSEKMLDLSNPSEQVEIRIRADGQVIWVNVDGICRLRICQIGEGIISLVDDRNITPLPFNTYGE